LTEAVWYGFVWVYNYIYIYGNLLQIWWLIITFLYVRIFCQLKLLFWRVYRNFPAQPYVQTNLGKAWVCLCPAMCTGGDGKNQENTDGQWPKSWLNDIGLVFTGFHTGFFPTTSALLGKLCNALTLLLADG
jgi:hypothetical protein